MFTSQLVCINCEARICKMECKLPNHYCDLFIHTYVHFCRMNERTSVLAIVLYVSRVGVYREWCCLCVATICSMMECKISFVSVNARVLQQIEKRVYVCIIDACLATCVRKLLCFPTCCIQGCIHCHQLRHG